MISLIACALVNLAPAQFMDVTEQVGLGGLAASRVCLVDLDGDGYSDAVVDRYRVFMNRPAGEGEQANGMSIGRRFVEIPPEQTGLLKPRSGGTCNFADLDNDGLLDAVITRYVDLKNEQWEDDDLRTAWRRGLGGGRFGPERPVEHATPATTCAIAIGDWDRDGRLDLYLGNWYEHYGETYTGFANEILLQRDGVWVRQAPVETGLTVKAEDAAGRPTYGVVMTHMDPTTAGQRPVLLDLNYGRRWNRLWLWLDHEETWLDAAPLVGFDGDAIRHGRYPDWLKERAKTDARFDRPDEEPFRANGNSFDAAVGDIDNDGDFDLFVTEITHAWAGESSDRSGFLVNQIRERGNIGFEAKPALAVDRIPTDVQSWNQGDLFAELADLDHDGWLDLILSSGDYPDNERLRVYRNVDGRAFEDVTEQLGIDHDGSQQISLGDVDGDGALDLLVGQTFFRYSAEQRAGREPRLRLFVNRAYHDRPSLVLRLKGDPALGVNRDAIGAVVEVQVSGRTMIRQLIPIGGHAGKQHDFLVHFGLGEVRTVDRLTVRWPGSEQVDRFENVESGVYRLQQGGLLQDAALSPVRNYTSPEAD
ncbi:MAG: CRTAC1 family protein [Phycisphaerales bacterium]|nr:CRTAC1 family protein [Phycisphaerales bacterium]